MKMSPASRNWEHHIRYLAAAIIRRGTDHAYSKTNFQLLASSALLLTFSTREPIDWQLRSPVRSAWLVEIRSALEKAGKPAFAANYEFYRSLDSLMTEATTIASTMAQFDQLFTNRSTTTGLEGQDSNQTLINLYHIAEDLLSRNEARLARWSTNVSEIPLSLWLSLHPDMATDPTSGYVWSSKNARDVRSYFETVLTFRTMMEYHSITIYWSMIMTLRLLLSDMLTLMVRTNVHGMPTDPQQKIEHHRIQLMKYALNVLRTICYATDTESRAVAPFAIATAFQLTVVVLERECTSLEAAAGNNEDGIRRCEGLKSLAVRYLHWAMQHKIPLKIDLGSPRKWQSASIA